MNFDGFEPFVLPFAPELPGPTLVHHVRQSAIRFFQLSKVWRETLDTVLGDGVSTSFIVLPDDQVTLVTIYDVTVGGCARAILTPGDALALVGHCYTECAWTEDLRTMNVVPAPGAGAEVKIRAALRPSQAAFEIPDILFEQYAQDIANGALSTALAIPGQPWTNLTLAAASAMAFTDAIGTASFTGSKGNVAKYARRSTYRSF